MKTQREKIYFLALSVITILWSACRPPDLQVDQPEFTWENTTFNPAVDIISYS
jgi:hypothetical protein